VHKYGTAKSSGELESLDQFVSRGTGCVLETYADTQRTRFDLTPGAAERLPRWWRDWI
jgi:hypothetical protein